MKDEAHCYDCYRRKPTTYNRFGEQLCETCHLLDELRRSSYWPKGRAKPSSMMFRNATTAPPPSSCR